MVYLFENSVWFGMGTVASTAISFVTLLAFANLLTKETYGVYQYVLATVDLLGIFALSGIDTAVTRSVARGHEGSLRDALRTKIKWGLIGGVAGISVGVYYLAQGNPTLGWSFVIAGLFIPVWEAPTFYVNYLQGKQRFDLTIAYETLVQLACALVIVPCLFFTNNVLIILSGYFLSYTGARFFFHARTFRKVPPNSIKDSELIPYGKHLTLMGIMNTAASSLDKVLLWHFIGPASVATYIFAQAIPVRVAGMIKVVNRIAFPKMVVQKNYVLQNTLMHKVFILVFVSTIASLLYALAVPWIFVTFLPTYVDAIPFAQTLACLIVLQPFTLLSSSLTAQAKKRSLYIFNFLSPLTRLTILCIFVWSWGLWGAVISLIVGKALESALLTYLFYRN